MGTRAVEVVSCDVRDGEDQVLEEEMEEETVDKGCVLVNTGKVCGQDEERGDCEACRCAKWWMRNGCEDFQLKI